jgi:hypothetical protein
MSMTPSVARHDLSDRGVQLVLTLPAPAYGVLLEVALDGLEIADFVAQVSGAFEVQGDASGFV